MEKAHKIITISFFVLLLLAGMFFLNGTTMHTIAEEKIKDDFLQQLSQKGMEKGAIFDECQYSNSKMLFFENQTQKMFAVYVKSIYMNQWKLYYLSEFQENTEVFVDDHIFQYRIKYNQQKPENVLVELVGQPKPLLAIRLFSLGVIIAAATIGRIVGVFMQKRKGNGFDKR